MWLLLIVFLNLDWGTAEIDRYETFEACQTERDRIGFAMAESYPEDHDFNIACQFVVQKA